MEKHRVDVSGVTVELRNPQGNFLLNSFCDTQPQSNSPAELVIESEPDGLSCSWLIENQKPLRYFIDVRQFTTRQMSYPAAKQGAFNQALGKRSKNIIDATGGWGSDAMLMCSQAYKVTILERNPIMALLLTDAMKRLSLTEWAESNAVLIPLVIESNAIKYLAAEDHSKIDCIYLDPMFPKKRKKSAASNKQMQLLQWMLGEDRDAEQLARIAVESAAKRVTVKRPDYAIPLVANPSNQFSSKLIHYDVYLKS